jgi:hypothetical protein
MEKQEEEGEYFGKRICLTRDALFTRFRKRAYRYFIYHIPPKHFKRNGLLF